MRDILNDLITWSQQGRSLAIATVIQTWGSSPRGVGANLALTVDGEMAGSVSGGCVEGAVLEAGIEVLKSARPQLLHFGVADETAWEVGLSCGGTIEIFVRPLDMDQFTILEKEIRGEKPVASVVVIRGPESMLGQEMLILEDGEAVGTFGRDLDHQVFGQARGAIAEGKPRRVEIPSSEKTSEPIELFINVEMPSPTLIVIGGVHIAIPLTSLAKTLGFQTVVVDPRKMFGTETRFPHVDQLIQAWPDQALEQVGLTSSTAITLLTHDPKLDDPALKVALDSPAFYIGALGSRKTHAARSQRLLEAGLTERKLERIHAPVGLDLGGRSPGEIALAIMAQIVKTFHT